MITFKCIRKSWRLKNCRFFFQDSKEAFPITEKTLLQHLDESSSSDESLHSTNQTHFLSPTYCVSKIKKENKNPKFILPLQDESDKSVLLFPGQGAQFVGMASKLLSSGNPAIPKLFETASEILGYDLLDLCLHGPEEKLNQTLYCQPATVVTSLAAVEYLYSLNPKIIQNCIKTAGFSVGELTALIFSGAISFENGIKLVNVRAKEMEKCSQVVKSGMMIIFYGKNNKCHLAVQMASRWLKEKHGVANPVIQIANHLYGTAKVLAGHEEALNFIENNKEDFNIRKVVRLNVSGAFHTPLMKEAHHIFANHLFETPLTLPRIPVYGNMDFSVYKSVSEIKKKLPSQIYKAVKWEQTINAMFPHFDPDTGPSIYECGPGKTLSGILRQINGKLSNKTKAVSV